MSEPVERPLLNLAHASTLVDAIEEALKACVHEDGRWKLLLATLTCVPRTHWSEAQVVSNRRATAIWVAMALAEEFRRQYLDDAAGEPESTPAAEADHGFKWLGQPFTSCDDCGRPAWEHPGMHRPDGDNPFAGGLGVVVPWEPGEVEAIRKKWDPAGSAPADTQEAP